MQVWVVIMHKGMGELGGVYYTFAAAQEAVGVKPGMGYLIIPTDIQGEESIVVPATVPMAAVEPVKPVAMAASEAVSVSDSTAHVFTVNPVDTFEPGPTKPPTARERSTVDRRRVP